MSSSITGTVRAVEAIVQDLGWRRAQGPVGVLGGPGPESLGACWDLGAAIAAGLSLPGG
jgi:hypothetical protein